MALPPRYCKFLSINCGCTLIAHFHWLLNLQSNCIRPIPLVSLCLPPSLSHTISFTLSLRDKNIVTWYPESPGKPGAVEKPNALQDPKCNVSNAIKLLLSVLFIDKFKIFSEKWSTVWWGFSWSVHWHQAILCDLVSWMCRGVCVCMCVCERLSVFLAWGWDLAWKSHLLSWPVHSSADSRATLSYVNLVCACLIFLFSNCRDLISLFLLAVYSICDCDSFI